MARRESILAALLLWPFVTVWLASCSAQGQARFSESDIPVASVQQTDLQLKVHATGELRSTRTAMMIAPAVAGGGLQIVHLLRSGMQIKAGDVVVEFDPSQQQYNADQSRSDLAQAEQEIVKARDDAAVQAAQDQTSLLKDQFAVRQAELDVSKNELVSSIDAQKNILALSEAKRALAQLQQDIQSHAASGQATIDLDQEKAHKARLAMDQALENIKNMQVRSSIGGLVVVRPNENASGGFFFEGMTLPDYQQGDQVSPGATIADVIDMNSMEIVARVSESDRVNVKIGQSVEVHVDALPDVLLQGTVKNVAAASGEFFIGSGGGSSEVTVSLNHADPKLRPGFTAHLVILGDSLKNALWIPREAIFEKDGKQIVYARNGNGFEPRSIQVRYLSEGTAVIAGLKAGAEIAVLDPTQQANGSSKTSPAGPMGSPQ